MKVMRFLLFIILACCCPITFAENHSELKALLSPISTLEANFQQTLKNEQGRLLQQLSGKVALKKPAQFRWEVLGKEARLVIADGEKIWDFDKDLEQITVQNLDQGQNKAPIYFLTGEVEGLEKDFYIKKLVTRQGICLEGSDTCFELLPKVNEGSFQWIKIGFKAKVLKEMQMLDQLGQYAHFTFKNVRLNTNIPATYFRFSPPKHIDVLVNG